MTQPQAPGVYIDETAAAAAAAARRIDGVPTATAGMVGVTKRGPKRPALITSFNQFVSKFGVGLSEPAAALRDKWAQDLEEGGQWWQLHLAVKGFFDNGGQRLYVKRIERKNPSALSLDDFVRAIQTFREVDEVAVCLAPGMWSATIHEALIKFCDSQRESLPFLIPRITSTSPASVVFVSDSTPPLLRFIIRGSKFRIPTTAATYHLRHRVTSPASMRG